MIPYIEIPPIDLGGDFVIRAFDILVALAVVVGVFVADRRAQRWGLSGRVITDVAVWAVVPGFICAHLVSVIFYFPERIAENPLELLNIFSGLSSFGGFLGGAAGVLYFFHRKKIPVWEYGDALVYGFTFAWIFGRLGCTFAHDHPGIETDFFLAVIYPENGGTPRHDLGFYEFLWALAMSAFFWWRRKRPTFPGFHLAVFLLAYTPLRFMGDFLRSEDATHGGLTMGQWIAILLLGVGSWLWISRRKDAYQGEVAQRRVLLTTDGQVHVFRDGTPAYRLAGQEDEAPSAPSPTARRGLKDDEAPTDET